jgi:tubulin--tyrosine ligase-like protein 12
MKHHLANTLRAAYGKFPNIMETFDLD